jgi:hypothetical protein
MFFVYIFAVVILIVTVGVYILSFNFNSVFDKYYVEYYQSYIIDSKNYSFIPYFYKIYNYDWWWYNDLSGDWVDDDLNEDNIYCTKSFTWNNIIDDDCFFRWEYGFLPPNVWINLGKFDWIFWSWLIFYFTGKNISNLNILVKYQNLDWRYIKYFLITWNSLRKHYFSWESFSLSLKNLNKKDWIFFNIFLSWWNGLRKVIYNGSWKWIVRKKFNIFPGLTPLFFYDVVFKNYVFENPTNPVNLKVITGDFDQINTWPDLCSFQWNNDVKLIWYRYPQFRYNNWTRYLNNDYINQIYFDIVVINLNWWRKKEIKKLKLSDYCNLTEYKYTCSINNIRDLNNFFTGTYLFKINVYRVLSWWIIFNQRWSYFKTWYINYCK